jgi:hypothetical protein
MEAEELGSAMGATVIGVDVTRRHAVDVMPNLATSAVLKNTMFRTRQDLSLKRNLGLLLACTANWRRVLFLDDDIVGTRPADVHTAAAYLDEHSAVGLRNVGFPDNSVVCHAFRFTSAFQDTFIGGGAMMVDPMTSSSFFPDVYNDDWIFLAGDARRRRPAVTGAVAQRDYDPFAELARSRREEFGDCLGEGLFWLLDEGLGLSQAEGTDFWRDFLSRRRSFLHELLHRVQWHPNPARRIRVNASVLAALARNSFVTPRLCTTWIRAWRDDLDRWREHVDSWTRGRDLDDALFALFAAS